MQTACLVQHSTTWSCSTSRKTHQSSAGRQLSCQARIWDDPLRPTALRRTGSFARARRERWCCTTRAYCTVGTRSRGRCLGTCSSTTTGAHHLAHPAETGCTSPVSRWRKLSTVAMASPGLSPRVTSGCGAALHRSTASSVARLGRTHPPHPPPPLRQSVPSGGGGRQG